jgi:hypothetical protein
LALKGIDGCSANCAEDKTAFNIGSLLSEFALTFENVQEKFP